VFMNKIALFLIISFFSLTAGVNADTLISQGSPGFFIPKSGIDNTDPNVCSGSLMFTPLCLSPLVNDSRVFSCLRYPQRGLMFVGSETEPHLAVHVVGSRVNVASFWQQDRAARLGGGLADVLTIGISEDGGETFTWKFSNPLIPNTRCSGAEERTTGAFDRASDPWVAFDQLGRLFAQSLNFDGLIKQPSGNITATRLEFDNTQKTYVPTSTSMVGSNPNVEVVEKMGSGAGVPLLDKNSLTVDPFKSNAGNPFLYSIWSKGTNKSDLYFSRSTDGGKTWEAARKIFTTESGTVGDKNSTFLVGAQIEVLGNQRLVAMFNIVSSASLTGKIGILQSPDGGVTWDRNPITPITYNQGDILDPKYVDGTGNPPPIRGVESGGLPDTSKLGNSLYIVYQDFDNTDPENPIAILKLAKLDFTSSGILNSQSDVSIGNNTFISVVDVAPNGRVGVLYNQLTGNVDNFTAGIFLKQFDSDLTEIITSAPLANNDIRKAPLLFGQAGVIPGGYFFGDYYGLAPTTLPFDGKNYFLIAIPKTTNDVCANPEISPPNPANPLYPTREIIGTLTPNAPGYNECNRNDIYFDKIEAE
jgi:hypothetical protein